MLKTNLPDLITLSDGAVLYPVIGGHLKQELFYTGPQTISALTAEAKRRGLRYRRVEVLGRNLRGKFDLHRQPYRPTQWLFVEVKRYKVERDCCTSGNCVKCITERRTDPSMKRFQPIRVIQLDNLSKEKAELVASNFRAYNSQVLPDLSVANES